MIYFLRVARLTAPGETDNAFTLCPYVREDSSRAGVGQLGLKKGLS
jgi:hypothetical protein